jgi:acetyltransferase-like isoleucine patch superfamily enzyme
MWSGNQVGHNSVIKDHCFVASQVVVSGNVTIEPNCFLGVNSTIRDGITVARECLIGAGALILKDTREREVYVGPRAQLSPIPSDRIAHL